MNLDTLANLSGRFTDEQLQVSAERCLNARFKQINCRVCIEVCPVDAIQITGGAVAIDAEVCVRCGACVWPCPPEVFALPHVLQVKLREIAQAAGVAPIELRCPQQSGDQTRVADVTIVQHPRCLAELAPSQLIELAANRDVWINDAVCAACPIGTASNSIERAVVEANRWRAAFNRPRQIHLLSAEIDRLVEVHAARVIDSVHPPSDRRAFFKLFTRTLIEAGTRAAGESDRTWVDDRRLPQHVPIERVGLLNAIEKLGKPQALSLDLPRVQVQESDCTACGLCAKLCPTGALRFQSDDARFALDFSAALCVDCGICEKACPTQAVTLSHDLPLSEFSEHKTQRLVDGSLAPCSVCQTPTAVQANAPAAAVVLCEVCRATADKPRRPSDFFGSRPRKP